MLSFLNQYAKNGEFSQNGEQGIVDQAFLRIAKGRSYECVEIGANNGLYCSNTAHLAQQGWGALFVEGDYNLYLQCNQNWASYPNVRSQCCYVDGHNINAFVDERCDLLSVDVDGGDYEIFKGLQSRPKIVIVEIDSSIEPPSERVNADGGVGYWMMVTLGLEKGFVLLVHCGNLIFIRQDFAYLFPECKPHPLLEWELYFNRSWL